MDATHIHLLVVHFPVVLSLLGLFCLIVAQLKSLSQIRDLALIVFMVSGLGAYVASASGEEAEDRVESIPGVSEQSIEEHEEAAEKVLWLAIATGVLSAAHFFFRKSSFIQSNTMVFLLMVLAIFSTIGISYTAWEGGKIRHTEIHSTNPPLPADSGEDHD